VGYDQGPVLAAFDGIEALDAHEGFRAWLKDGLVSGFGIGRTEPWTVFAEQGYS
jgi:hypothetical protein